MSLDVMALREELPQLARCVYLNSNSTGAVPRGVDRVLAEHARTLRDFRDSVWERWLEELAGYADALSRFVGGGPGEIALDASVSALLGRVLSCFDYRDRPCIVTTDLEFPTVERIARGFARYGAETIVVPTDGRAVIESRVLEAIDARTQLVVVSLATYATGSLTDVATLCRAAHDAGALVAVDAFAAVGVVPIDVRALGADFVLGGAHKWMCGAHNCAFLWVRPELVSALSPACTGWMASEDPLRFGFDGALSRDARRFACGTPLVLPALLSRVGLDLLSAIGVDAIRARSLSLTDHVLARADRAGLEVLGPRAPERRGGIVALRFPHDLDVARALVARGFVCSHRGALRVAPHVYNTHDEVDAFMDALVAEVERWRHLDRAAS